MLRTLRSTEWDGPPPSSGDVLVDDDDRHWLVRDVADGPGCGQYRIEVAGLGRVYRWRERLDSSPV